MSQFLSAPRFGLPPAVSTSPTPAPWSSESLSWWKDILYFDVPFHVSTALIARSMSVQTIPGAFSTSPINFDYYPVTVNRWPTTEAGVLLGSAESLLEHMRLNINTFVGSSAGEFAPYGAPDTVLWKSSAPVGAVMHIDLRVGHWAANPDDGSVVVSSSASNHFQFSTVSTPADLGHPVSGHRRFGFGVNSGPPVTFFAAGVDRLHTQFDYFVGETVFAGGDTFWRSWQRGFANWINGRTGDPSAAVIGAPISKRYDYPDVLATYPR